MLLPIVGWHFRAFTSLLPEMDAWSDRFSIIDFYLQACASHRIIGVEKKDLHLVDVGKLDTLHAAESFLNAEM